MKLYLEIPSGNDEATFWKCCEIFLNIGCLLFFFTRKTQKLASLFDFQGLDITLRWHSHNYGQMLLFSPLPHQQFGTLWSQWKGQHGVSRDQSSGAAQCSVQRCFQSLSFVNPINTRNLKKSSTSDKKDLIQGPVFLQVCVNVWN